MRVREGDPVAVPDSLTEEEKQQGLAVVQELVHLQEQLLKRRGGKRFGSSWRLINEQREIRTRHLTS
jgi:hypothetical protein